MIRSALALLLAMGCVVGCGEADPPGLAVETEISGDAPPAAQFFRTRADRRNVIYLIDRSGSMLDTLDLAKRECLRSISRLKEGHRFHVIFFAQKQVVEAPARQLVPATQSNKRVASKFVWEVQARGQTDPLPGIRRAIELAGK